MSSRNIAEKVRGLFRDRTGRLFGNSTRRLPPTLQDPTLAQELRARLHQTQLKLRANQSRQRVRRTWYNDRKSGVSKDLPPSRTADLPPSRTANADQIKTGSRQRKIDDLYRAMWNRILSDITRAVVKKETNNWPEYFRALRELVSKVVMDSKGRGLFENEKTDPRQRLLGRINELENQW